jgi:protoporphyrinogen/coproporphyrinogen III oxidase
MPDWPTTRIAVVGGGISGLSAAHRLLELADQTGRPIELTLFEASERFGGVFGTQTIDGYTIETGADSFITSKPWGIDLCRRVGLADQLISTDDEHRRSLILHEGRPVPTPEGFELLVPRSLRALLASPLLSTEGKLRAAAEGFVPPRTDQSDESLAAFVRRRFGQELLERIVQPLVGGIYTSDPEQLSVHATLPRFVEMEREHGSLLRAVWQQRRRASQHQSPDKIPSGARYGLFVSLRDGMSTLLEALESRLQGRCTLHRHAPIASVTPQPGGGYSLAASNGNNAAFDRLIIALPTYRAADLIESWDGDLAARLRGIEYASSAIIVTGHHLKDVAHPLDAFGLVIPHLERRRIIAVSFLSRKFPARAPEGDVLLRTFVGGAMQPELLDCDDDQLVRLVRDELQQLLGVRGKPTVCVVTRYDRAMPQYHVGHEQRVAGIEAAVEAHPGIALAGNAYHGVGLPDAIHSGQQAADQIFASLSS